MSAGRVIDDHLELANIGTKTHANIEGHIQGIGNYAFPAADGAINQILETDGAGVLSWVNKPAGFACGDLNACNLTDIGTRAHSSLTGIGVSDHHTDHQVASAEDANFKSVNIIAGEAYKQAGVNLLKAKATGNLFIGEDAGKDTTGGNNIFIGYHAGLKNQGGRSNVYIGYEAGYVPRVSEYNVFIGYKAGRNNTTGAWNTFIGYYAGFSDTSGELNTFIGYESGYINTIGSYNTFIGYRAGYSMVSGLMNVFIGFKAGYNETGSNKIYIAIGSTNASTLIHGEFDNKYLFHKGAASAPADAKFHNSDINFWIDEVNDQLEIKVKKSNGAIITGNVQLV